MSGSVVRAAIIQHGFSPGPGHTREVKGEPRTTEDTFPRMHVSHWVGENRAHKKRRSSASEGWVGAAGRGLRRASLKLVLEDRAHLALGRPGKLRPCEDPT